MPNDETKASDKPNLGRTIGDLVHEVITSPLKGLSLLGVLTLAVTICLGGAWVAIRLFDVQTSEVRIGGTDPHVLLQSKGKNGDVESLIIVSPQGWQISGISVKNKDHLVFTSGGKISIDVHSINEEVERRLVLEKKYEQKLHLRRNDPTEKRVPETYFSEEEKRSLVLERPWVTPDGFTLDKFLPSFRSRAGNYLLPEKPAGGLVVAIKPDTEAPSREDAVFIGRQSEIDAQKDGVLWFTVNDVQFSDPNNPNLFYNDNVGSFWVRVAVKSKK